MDNYAQEAFTQVDRLLSKLVPLNSLVDFVASRFIPHAVGKASCDGSGYVCGYGCINDCGYGCWWTLCVTYFTVYSDRADCGSPQSFCTSCGC